MLAAVSSRPRKPVLAAIACLALSGGGCGPSTESLPVADLLPVMRRTVASPELFPGPAAVLGTGTRLRRLEDGTSLLLMRGHRAVVGFPATGEESLRLRLELRQAPGDDAASRQLQILVNDTRLYEGALPDRWSLLEVAVEASLLRSGVNRLELRVSTVPEDPVDRPVTPVRVRSIRAPSESGRPPWPGRPDIHIRPAADAGTEDGPEGAEGAPAVAGDLVLPVGSSVELAVRLDGDVRLLSALTATGAPGQARRPLQASVEAPGEPPLFTATLRPDEPGGGTPLDVDLAGLRGRVVRLRLRVSGTGNGTVRWAGLRFVHPRGAPPVALPRLPRAPEPAAVAEPPSPELVGRDVVIILLDAARADAYSPYDAERPTPAVAALAAESVVFERAHAAAPWTAPSVATLLTGLLPDAHGVESWDSWLPKPVTTLGERFRAAGYHTVIWSQHLLYRTNPTLERGFDVVYTSGPEDREALPDVADLFDSERPSLVIIHLLVPHAPYVAPPPHRGRYADPSSAPNIDVDDADFARPFQRSWDPATPTEAQLRLLRDRYDETVAWSDELVSRLLHRLREAGRYDDALLVLTSDHGEAFYEHGTLLHTGDLHDEVLRVPLLIRLPTGRSGGRRVPGPVSLLDLPATLVAALGLPRPERLPERGEGLGLQGRDLRPHLQPGPRGAAASPDRNEASTGTATAYDGSPAAASTYATTRSALFRRQAGHRLISLQLGPHKVIHDTLWQTTRLYDTTADPGETRDLSISRPALALWLVQSALAQHTLNTTLQSAYAGSDPTGADLDLSELESLEALGYIR